MIERQAAVSGPTTVRDATMDLLRKLGITKIFGNPGSAELPMLTGFPDDIDYVLGLEESAVLSMADAYALSRRHAAVVNLHSAAGVGHAMGSLFTAYRNHAPLVIIAGQQARSLLPSQPFLFSERATEMPQPYVKWSIEPARPEDVPGAIERAYHVAMQSPQGPTLVSVPLDDWDRPCMAVTPRVVSSIVQGDETMLKQVAAVLARAGRVAFVAGDGVARDSAWDEIVQLAERHGARVYQSPYCARNCFPEDHPLFAGFLFSERSAIREALAEYDVVLVLGAPAFLLHVEGGGADLADNTEVYQIVDDPALATSARVGTAIVGNVRSALREILKGEKPPEREAPAPRATPPSVDTTALTSELLAQEIERLRRRDSIVILESPSALPAVRTYMPMVVPDGFFTGASGCLGYGIPATVGLALANPGKQVIGMIGDGSSMYCSQGLWTAGALGTPMTFIIVRNGRYACLIDVGHQLGIQETVGMRLPGIDFVALAQAHGVEGLRVTDPSKLSDVLGQAFASPRPTLVEVNVL